MFDRRRRVATLLATLFSLSAGCPTGDTEPQDDQTQHCLDEGAYTCIDGDYYVCESSQWTLEDACADQCDIELGCVECTPSLAFCDANVAMLCAADGQSASVLMDCDEFEVECLDGECQFDDPCEEAAAWESNIGCEYWAVDLDNSENFIDDAAGAQFAVAVANIGGDIPAHVEVEINNGWQGEPLELELIDQADVDPGELHIFRLPRRDVDGVNMVANIDDGPQSWLASWAFRITSDTPIVAYQFNPLDQQFSNDASLLLPTTGLGQDHLVVTYTPANPVDTPMSPMNRTYVTVVGVEPETTVHVTPSYDITYGPGDCMDNDPWIYPTAVEMCDGKDNNCDGELPEDELDGDGDGWSSCMGDCDEADASTYPFAGEICDGLDNDCNVFTDEGVDGDGDGYSVCDGDCDDTDAATYPGALEDCDGVDNDCDGLIPEDESDRDYDGYMGCDDDCDDLDPLTYPFATEICDGIDNDCDGVDEASEDDDLDGLGPCDGDCDDRDAGSYTGATELCDGLDNDCDGIVPADEVDVDGDGAFACEDCDDTDPDTYPDAPELCDGIDNDCDGELLETADEDGDGFPPCTGVDEVIDGIAVLDGQSRTWTIGEFDTLNLETTFMTVWPPSDIPDLTGTWITSDKPVAVFTGVDMTMAVFHGGEDSCCAEHIEQQIIPSKSMGRSFVVSRSAIRSWDNPEPDLYRIIAYTDGTVVETSLPQPNDTFNLNAGEYHEFWSAEGFIVDSTGPLHVAQILAVGTDAINADWDAKGDSALLYVPAVEQRRPLYLFTTGEGFTLNYAVISKPAGVTATIDGFDVNAPLCYGPLPNGTLDGVDYEMWQCEISEGVHTVHSGTQAEGATDPIAVFVYGYYNAGSYAYPAGADLKPVNELSPN